MPLIDIFIPVYNAEAFLEDTIKSVLSQTYTDWKLIIVDDCSTDNSYEIAKKYAQNYPAITAVKNDHNLGMMTNWNKGISLGHAPFFVKLDSDDIWHPKLLEKSIDCLNTYPSVGIVFCRYSHIDENGELLSDSNWELPEFAIDKPFSCIPLVKEGPNKMFSYPILRQGLSIVRKRVLDHVGLYSNLRSVDTEYYFKIGCHYEIYCINETLYYYRQHTKSDSIDIEKAGLRDLLINEAMLSIINYYYENNKIGLGQYEYFTQQLDFQRNVSLFPYYWKKRLRVKAIMVILHNLFLHKRKTVYFYTNRFIQKIKRNA